MTQFLVEPDAVREDERTAWVRGDEAHHLVRVYRARPGDSVELFDGAGRRWGGTLAEARGAEIRIAGIVPLPANESPVELWLLQALLKGERWDWLLAKATELGVSRVLPLRTEHTVAARDEKAERWRAILQAAAKQCDRGSIPALDAPTRLVDALAALGPARPGEVRLALLERETAAPPPSDEAPRRACLAVGPEGGWSAPERAALLAAGFRAASLGPRILRAETAAVAALALAQARWGDLDR